MNKLPLSLQIHTLLGLSIPADLTLAEAKVAFSMAPYTDQMHTAIQAQVTRKLNPLCVRFVDEILVDLPDDMVFGQFQKLADIGKAKVLIDEGDGGVTAKQPELV